MLQAYSFLILAILFETVGTTALQASQQFSRLVPSLVVIVAYGLAFYFLAFALRFMPVGIAYAIWSGLGIVFIAGIGLLVFGQRLDLPALLGIAMILGGILVIHIFSGSATH